MLCLLAFDVQIITALRRKEYHLVKGTLSRLNHHLPWQLGDWAYVGLRWTDDIEKIEYPQPHSFNLQIPLTTVTMVIKEAVTRLKDIASYGRDAQSFQLSLDEKRETKDAMKKTWIELSGWL